MRAWPVAEVQNDLIRPDGLDAVDEFVLSNNAFAEVLLLRENVSASRWLANVGWHPHPKRRHVPSFAAMLPIRRVFATGLQDLAPPFNELRLFLRVRSRLVGILNGSGGYFSGGGQWA